MFRSFGKKDKSKSAKPGQPASEGATAATNGGGPSPGSATSTPAGSSAGTGGGANGGSRNSAAAGAAIGAAGASSGASKGVDKFDKLTLLTALSLKDVSAADQPKLFAKHLKLCHQCFDFTEMSKTKEKEAKRLLLLGLVDYINSPQTRINESEFGDIIGMVSANIFRSLPPRIDTVSDDEEDPVLESSWPHLHIVYEFLLRFIISGDVEPKPAKRYVSNTFILQLLGLFDSEDPRERDYLKTILHRIYGKFMALRAFVRKAITNVFLSCIYLEDRHNGIAELLEILGSIINGFALPLKVEHKRFLTNGLIPLHKVRHLGTFNQQLTYCLSQYVEKDNKMAEPVIQGLLKYWPEVNSPKQIQFINEIEEVLVLTQVEQFKVVVGPLFSRLAACIGSQHFQVAERTLLLWNSEYIFTLITQNRAVILPLLFSVLAENSVQHWNQTVQNLSQNVLKSFQDTDKALYEVVSKSSATKKQEDLQARADRASKWEQLEAAYGSPDNQPAPVPPSS